MTPQYSPFQSVRFPSRSRWTALWRCATCKTATHGADDGELFIERRKSEVLSFDDGRVKTADG